ncbi:MAG: glutamate--tRNA ligase [Gammaproteobacteria bacterium]|nr:glutamate--tRNA ligase [Gammaproteobacteria bacterium]
MTVRTRFAPSPTGYLHIGGARTALYSWLYAHRHHGVFVLRIEDTDLERSTTESVNAILEAMDFLGLSYDEGPFYQTKRFDRYREVLKQMLAQGHAYYCTCSKEELAERRAAQEARKEKPRYDRRCRNRPAPADVSRAVIRFKNPLDGDVVVNDAVKGRVTFANDELDDLIIARADGTPTYNFTVVVDDMDMNITHVIRGDDHLTNTPRQINILRALDAPLPVYAHIPMILGEDGARLSKRHGAVSVMQYHDDGYLPEALLNYLVRLGWSHGDQEIFSREEMTGLFDIEDIHRAAASINPKKLLWLNQHYLKTLPVADVAQRLRPFLVARGVDPEHGPQVDAVVELQRERAKTLVEMAELSRFFFVDEIEVTEPKARAILATAPQPALQAATGALEALADWNAAAIHDRLTAVATEYALPFGKLAQPIRVAVAGSTVSPPIDTTLSLLGRTRTLQRLRAALAFRAPTT